MKIIHHIFMTSLYILYSRIFFFFQSTLNQYMKYKIENLNSNKSRNPINYVGDKKNNFTLDV